MRFVPNSLQSLRMKIRCVALCGYIMIQVSNRFRSELYMVITKRTFIKLRLSLAVSRNHFAQFVFNFEALDSTEMCIKQMRFL